MDENSLLYTYIKELNEEAKLLDHGVIDSLFAKLISLEKSFEVKLRKTAKGRKIYAVFINMIYKSNRGMISLRPYFRQREHMFLGTINKAVENNKPEELYGSPVNYRFMAFALECLNSANDEKRNSTSDAGENHQKELADILEKVKIVRNEIVNSNLFLSLGRAKIHSRSSYSSSIDTSDLVQIANEALITAVDKYVPDSRSVFAHMAIGRIIANLIAEGSSPSSATINSSGKKKLYRIRKALEKAPSANRAEIAKILEIAEQEVNELLESTHYSSLDQPLYEGDTRTLGDTVEDVKTDPHNEVERRDMFMKLFRAYDSLSVIEMKVLRLKGVNPMRTLNKHVAVTVPTLKKIEERTVKGFQMSENLTTALVESQVMFDSEKFKVGEVVYFRADIKNHSYMSQKYNFGGKEFLLVPEEMVVAVKSADEA
jgi:RNA polymerase sigma factor (sigma-70 family)